LRKQQQVDYKTNIIMKEKILTYFTYIKHTVMKSARVNRLGMMQNTAMTQKKNLYFAIKLNGQKCS